MRKNLYASENSVLYTQLLMDYIVPEFSPLGKTPACFYMCFKIMYNNLINGII